MAESGERRRRSWKKMVLWTVVGLVVLFGLIQLVPFGRDHTNPNVTSQFQWASADAEAIARQSCYDCHSNETKWWWATNIAPFSWLVQADVNGGREHLNFSDWQGGPEAQEFEEAVNHGMPPFQYTLLHPGAKLTDAEKKTLIDGYAASLSANQGSTPSSPPSSDPTAIIAARCASCHSAQLALDYRATSADQAAQLLDRMVQRGATLTDAERQALIKYFTQ